MWLSKRLAEREREDASALSGTVTIDGKAPGVFARGEQRNAPIASPGGYAWRPKGGESVLLLKGGAFEEEAYVVGAVGGASDVAAGEVCVYSAGNARIALRNDGRVEITGELYINGEKYEPPKGADDGIEIG